MRDVTSWCEKLNDERCAGEGEAGRNEHRLAPGNMQNGAQKETTNDEQ